MQIVAKERAMVSRKVFAIALDTPNMPVEQLVSQYFPSPILLQICGISPEGF